jgi:DNA-binding response OmpR family regulator
MKVLLVEDDTTMLSLLTTLLKIEGFEVSILEDDSEDGILATICKRLPDLVLMDVNLRRASGVEVLRRVRQMDNLRGVRVLMSSGMDYQQECLEAGADSFILKPYMPEDLLRRMQEVLAVRND